MFLFFSLVLNFLSAVFTESVLVVLSVFRWPVRRGKNITHTHTHTHSCINRSTLSHTLLFKSLGSVRFLNKKNILLSSKDSKDFSNKLNLLLSIHQRILKMSTKILSSTTAFNIDDNNNKCFLRRRGKKEIQHCNYINKLYFKMY